MKVQAKKTEVIRGKGRVVRRVTGFFSRAGTRLDMSVSYIGPRTGVEFIDVLKSARKRGVKARMVTLVTEENIKATRAASKFLEIRHVSGLTGNSWAVTDNEYISSLSTEEFRPTLPVIYSNDQNLVAEHLSIFDALWTRGELLEERIGALEGGTDFPELEIVRDRRRIKELYLSLARQATKELLLLLPSATAFRRDDELGIMEILEERASKGVQVRVLTPVDNWVLARLPTQPYSHIAQSLAYRAIPAADARDTVTILVVDRSISLTLEESHSAGPEFAKAVTSAVLVTREPRVRQSIRFFERVWADSELRQAADSAREREEASRKRAELMQDILTHDIRNFNQVAMLNAELLGEQVRDHESTRRLAAIIRAVDGSSRLIERAKKLGNILSARGVDLQPVSLKASFERSLSLVRKVNATTKIKAESRLAGQVLADELLDEVFVNILSNAVKYSDGNAIHIAADQKSEELRFDALAESRPGWRISISDWGRGIPEDMKDGLFTRYMATAKGSGLGLSIVHALVTERYGGAVGVRNRVDDDFTKGTTVVILLPRA
ncbi:MAG: HAMP domain-containing histidine kinase [Thaumarchaeota archaeon]|nr:HAMP domain-containing histidine kinase [Nitrososphaerota archaeon]